MKKSYFPHKKKFKNISEYELVHNFSVGFLLIKVEQFTFLNE